MGRLLKRGERGNLPKIEYENIVAWRLLAKDKTTNEISIVGIFDSFAEARDEVDRLRTDNIYFYIHGGENRVLYSSEEQ